MAPFQRIARSRATVHLTNGRNRRMSGCGAAWSARGSWGEALATPASGASRVAEPIVQPARAALPELDAPRVETEAAPVRRPRNRAASEAHGDAGEPCLQRRA